MKLKVGPLVGISEISAMAKVSKQTVTNWRSRPSSDFPDPVTELASGPVFSVEDVIAWLDERGVEMSQLCPVCLNSAERGRDKDYGERKQVRCPRCGPFVVTRTALAMLHSRMNRDQLARARLSHAIRHHTSEEDWLMITSMNLDSLLASPLPDIQDQLTNLARWLSQELGDDHHRAVPYVAENLAGVVGVANGERVERLLRHAEKQELVELDSDTIRLTPAGWEIVSGKRSNSGKRRKPDWTSRIEDPAIRGVIDEVYRAVESNSPALASMGARALLDRAMVLRVGDRGGFAQKLNYMVDQGYISENERDILEAITDAGNASAHRAYTPSKETLNDILDVTESFLHRQFVAPGAVDAIKSATPPRRR